MQVWHGEKSAGDRSASAYDLLVLVWGDHLMRAASRDEDALFTVLLKVPGLNAILCLELLQMLTAQIEGLKQKTTL